MKTKLFLFLGLFLTSHHAWALSMTVTGNLSFGSIVPDASGGAIALSSSNSISNVTGNAILSGGHSRGQLRISTDYDQYTGVGLNNTTLSGPGGTTISITHTTQTSSNSTYKYVYVGARATYPSNAPAGTYSGTMKADLYDYELFEESDYIPVSLEVLPPPITVNETQTLNFGQVIADPAGGEITINYSGTVSNVVGNSTFQGTSNNGSVAITGAPNTQVFVSYRPTTLTSPGKSTTITLDTMAAAIGNQPTLNASGNATLSTRGFLTFPANTEAGVYSGNYNVTVNY